MNLKSQTKQKILNYDDFFIELNFKKRLKNMRLSVDKNAKVMLNVPFYTTQKKAIEFIDSNLAWIKTHLKKVKENLPKDDEFLLLGKVYKIKFDENLDAVNIINDEIFAKNLAQLQKFKKAKAKEIFGQMIQKFLPYVGKEVHRVSIKTMNTRWGSCNTRKGYINLNLNLIQKEPKLIEYVVLHELTHLIYPHHKASFYEFISQILSDYKDRQRALKSS
ncbi:MAG: M48 family metallopeptidase [Campylobacter sp.]|nr:M48 family metallopeptidase [Campylobacter sp.]